MRLPQYDRVEVPKRKITDYLLSSSHPSGQDKAVFFTMFGFSVGEWERLADALKAHAGAYNVSRVETSPFGTRYVVEGRLQTPSGRAPRVRSVWFVDEQGTAPRFVTAYPLQKDHDR